MLVSCLAYCSTLKMETICTSNISFDFQWATSHDIPEHKTLYAYLIYNDICFIFILLWMHILLHFLVPFS
jgi:hypothetical protein